VTADRIDTIRNSARGTIGLINLALEHLDDLRALAYDRPRAAAQQRRSSNTDYALDTHGDPRARAAYEQLGAALLRIHQDAAAAVHTALQQFDPGLIRGRRDQTADATTPEVIASIANHQKRHANGEAGSTPTIAQPLPKGAARALDAVRLRQELDSLQSAVRKTGIRPDRSRLTPLELNAWHTAMGTTSKRKKSR
jgi:hypothetical protein